MSGRHDKNAYEIFVGKLPLHCTLEQLHEIADPFQPANVRLFRKGPQNPPCGFLKFDNSVGAENFIKANHDTRPFGGEHNITVEYSNGEASKKVFIGGLERSATEEAIKEICSPYGKIMHVKILVKPNATPCAFVQFDDEDAVAACIAALNGKPNSSGQRNYIVRSQGTHRQQKKMPMAMKRSAADAFGPNASMDGSVCNAEPQYGMPMLAPAGHQPAGIINQQSPQYIVVQPPMPMHPVQQMSMVPMQVQQQPRPQQMQPMPQFNQPPLPSMTPGMPPMESGEMTPVTPVSQPQVQSPMQNNQYPGGNHCRIYVENFPLGTTEEQMVSLLQLFGNPAELSLYHQAEDRLSALVEFESSSQASAACTYLHKLFLPAGVCPLMARFSDE